MGYVPYISMMCAVRPPQAEGDGGFAAWESWARLQRAHTGLGRTAGSIRRGICAGIRRSNFSNPGRQRKPTTENLPNKRPLPRLAATTGCESWPQPSIIAQCSTPKHGGTADSEHPSGNGVHTERLPAVSGCCPCRLYKPIKHKNALFEE